MKRLSLFAFVLGALACNADPSGAAGALGSPKKATIPAPPKAGTPKIDAPSVYTTMDAPSVYTTSDESEKIGAPDEIVAPDMIVSPDTIQKPIVGPGGKP